MRTNDGISTLVYIQTPAIRRWRWNAYIFSGTDGRAMWGVRGRAFTRRGAERGRARGLRQLRAMRDAAWSGSPQPASEGGGDDAAQE